GRPEQDAFAYVAFPLSVLDASDGNESSGIRIPVEVLLAAVTVDKTNFGLKLEDAHLLKPAKLNSTVPKSTSGLRSPASLELARSSVNESLERLQNEFESSLASRIQPLWAPLKTFLVDVESWNAKKKEWVRKGLPKSLEFGGLEMKTFEDMWTAHVEGKFKADSDRGTLDAVFATYISSTKTSLEKFKASASSAFLENATSLVDSIPSIESDLSKAKSNISSRLRTELARSHAAITSSLALDTLLTDLDQLSSHYTSFVAMSPATPLKGRLERLSNKEYRKRWKKLEARVAHSRKQIVEAISRVLGGSMELAKTLLEEEVTPFVRVTLAKESQLVGAQYRTFFATPRVKDIVDVQTAILSEYRMGLELGRKVVGSILAEAFVKEAEKRGLSVSGQSASSKKSGRGNGTTSTQSQAEIKHLQEASVQSVEYPSSRTDSQEARIDDEEHGDAGFTTDEEDIRPVNIRPASAAAPADEVPSIRTQPTSITTAPSTGDSSDFRVMALRLMTERSQLLTQLQSLPQLQQQMYQLQQVVSALEQRAFTAESELQRERELRLEAERRADARDLAAKEAEARLRALAERAGAPGSESRSAPVGNGKKAPWSANRGSATPLKGPVRCDKCFMKGHSRAECHGECARCGMAECAGDCER
ncbi:hypothetical protein HDU93_001404, partial [Gonapodya sp. JEL0774]